MIATCVCCRGGSAGARTPVHQAEQAVAPWSGRGEPQRRVEDPVVQKVQPRGQGHPARVRPSAPAPQSPRGVSQNLLRDGVRCDEQARERARARASAAGAGASAGAGAGLGIGPGCGRGLRQDGGAAPLLLPIPLPGLLCPLLRLWLRLPRPRRLVLRPRSPISNARRCAHSFTEMPTNNFVESSFWNFDTLFQPQQHPSRDAHDTFFLSGMPDARPFVHAAPPPCSPLTSCPPSLPASIPPEPAATRELPADYLQRVQAVHETGGYGSIGYRSPWKLEEAQKNILRTHTTAVSSRMLYRLAQEVCAKGCCRRTLPWFNRGAAAAHSSDRASSRSSTFRLTASSATRAWTRRTSPSSTRSRASSLTTACLSATSSA